jgi:phospholipid/cholesterol/gamma-HCH transport system substrate-binding protein
VETRAHYALVGGVALLLLISAVLFVLWLGQLGYRRELMEYDVVFEGPVRGVTESSEVRFNGIKVGDITRLGLDPSNPNNVIARIQIDALTPVKTDSTAQIEPQGITGVSYIQITGGSPNAPFLREGNPPIIYAKQGPLEGFVANAEDVMNAAEGALQRLEVLLNDDNLATVQATLENIEAISADLQSNMELVAEARDAVVTITATAAEWQSLAATGRELVDGDAREALANMNATTQRAEEAAEEIREFAELANATLQRYAGGGASELTLLIADMRSLAQSLEVAVTDIQQNPAGLIAGSRQQQVEVPR